VFSTLLQVLDDGHLTDGLGRKINFKNCVIIMTSNIGVRKFQDFGTGVGFKTSTNTYIEEEQKRDILKKELQKFFAPEFLNRIDEVIVFNTLKEEEVKQIVKLEIDKLISRLQGLNYNITCDENVLELISKVGFDETYGARPIKRAIQDKIEDFISEEVLNGNVKENEEYILTAEEEIVKFKEKEVKKTKKKKGTE
jgi:ATP-dependent Clp protease ATP-binding subunit ClpC